MNKLKAIAGKIIPRRIINSLVGLKNYKSYQRRGKNKEFVFDAIFSVGNACRPAHFIGKHGMRLCASPLDWMMAYSLETTQHLFETDFSDFFSEYQEMKEKPSWFLDTKNDITSIHYPKLGAQHAEFKSMMRKRFALVKEILKGSDKICFLSNRDEDMVHFQKFLEAMSQLYEGELTYMNVRNNPGQPEVTLTKRLKVGDRCEIIELEFNDVHPNGGNATSNPDFWIGNYPLWDKLMERIHLRVSYKQFQTIRSNQR